MAKVSMTASSIVNLGLWGKVCEYKGWNPWILNEGQISDDEVVEFDDEFKKDESSDETVDKEFILELFGVKVLGYDHVDQTDESIQYNEVTFLIDSLKEYDGLSIEVKHDWNIVVWSNEGEVIKESLLIENDEFRQKLYNKYPL